MRRSVNFIVQREGRDQGGVFVLTELPAFQATELCLRAMQLIARGGVDVPPHIFQLGAAGFVTMGAGAILAGIGKTPWYEIKPLLDELLPCVVSYKPPSGAMPLTGWETIKTQIEEPATILQLYEEVVSLNLGFSLSAKLSTFRTLAMGMIAGFGQSPGTSTEPLPPSSEAASPP